MVTELFDLKIHCWCHFQLGYGNLFFYQIQGHIWSKLFKIISNSSFFLLCLQLWWLKELVSGENCFVSHMIVKEGWTSKSIGLLYLTVNMAPAPNTNIIGERKETMWALKCDCLRKCVLACVKILSLLIHQTSRYSSIFFRHDQSRLSCRWRHWI